MTGPTPGADRDEQGAEPGVSFDPAELRRQVEYAEPRIRAGMVSAFARLLIANPKAAKERLDAVNDKIDLTGRLIRRADPNLESRFFAAAESVLHALEPEQVGLEQVRTRMLAHGATEDDLARVEDMIDAGAERFADSSFERYAGTFHHLLATRMTLDQGARVEADPRLVRSAVASDRVAMTLRRVEYTRDQLDRAAPSQRKDAHATGMLALASIAQAFPALAARATQLSTELARHHRASALDITGRLGAVQNAASALEEALDFAHASSPAPRPETVRSATTRPGPRHRGRST